MDGCMESEVKLSIVFLLLFRHETQSMLGMNILTIRVHLSLDYGTNNYE